MPPCGTEIPAAPVNGKHDLRTAIAERTEARTGVPTTAENVFVTTGGQGALFAAMMGACEIGDNVTIIDPYYATYPATVRAAGANVAIHATNPDHGFQPQRDALTAATEGASALLINTPNNPTGAVYSDETLAGIRDACLRNDLWLISDEVYDTQTHGPAHVSPGNCLIWPRALSSSDHSRNPTS